MKKSNKYKGKKQLTKKQIKALENNPFCILYNAKTELEVIIALAVISVPITKGNLGFTVNERDGDFIIKARALHAALFANTGGYYSPPFVNLADLDTAIDELVARIADVEARIYGSESAKVVAKRNVMRLLKKAMNYINNLAFDDQTNSGEIITGAKCIINKPTTRDKPDLKAVNGPGTGVVRLFAKAVKLLGKYQKTTYEWQYSIDNGKTWENIPYTTKAKAKVLGMLPGIATLFRKRTFSEKTGLSLWSDPIEFYPM